MTTDESTLYLTIFAGISAVLTLIYVVLTFRLSSTNSKMLKEQLRPYVIIKIYSEDYGLNINIENIGKRPAFDLNIEIIPGFEEIKTKFVDYQALLKQKFLPPDFKITNLIQITKEFLDKRKDMSNIDKHKIIIKYKDADKHQYSESYEIDLSQYVIGETLANFSDFYHINQGMKALEEISRQLKKQSFLG